MKAQGITRTLTALWKELTKDEQKELNDTRIFNDTLWVSFSYTVKNSQSFEGLEDKARIVDVLGWSRKTRSCDSLTLQTRKITTA